MMIKTHNALKSYNTNGDSLTNERLFYATSVFAVAVYYYVLAMDG
jgi:hypothetical protein